jgi:hypothetical protein
MGEFTYLSEPWFRRVDRLIHGRCNCEQTDLHFRIRYLVDDDEKTSHEMEFCGQRLVVWELAGNDACHAEISRTRIVDMGDLLARALPNSTSRETTFRLLPSNCQFDIFGIGTCWQRDIPDVDPVLTIAWSIHVLDSPFGEVAHEYWLAGTRLIAKVAQQQSPQVAISMPYIEFIDWLHLGQLGLGQYLLSGNVSGQIERISALSGIVSDVEQQHPLSKILENDCAEFLKRYQQIRKSSLFMSDMDQVDDFTAQSFGE